MALSLIKRLEKGSRTDPSARITCEDYDQTMTAIEEAVNARPAVAGGVLDLAGVQPTGYLAAQDEVTGDYTFVQADSGREKVFMGDAAVDWTVPDLAQGTEVIVHNIGSASIRFQAQGVTLMAPSTLLGARRSCSLTWLPGGIVKLMGEFAATDEDTGPVDTLGEAWSDGTFFTDETGWTEG